MELGPRGEFSLQLSMVKETISYRKEPVDAVAAKPTELSAFLSSRRPQYTKG